MTESIITISVIGLLAGFVFSMPIAGPISILVTTNALKGRLRYCSAVNIGASFATFAYVFFAVFGLAKLYPIYKPAVPYLLFAGSIFLFFIGTRISRTKIDIDIESYSDGSHPDGVVKKKGRGGFYTGFIINFFNPTLFIGWLSSTFLVITFVTSLGLNTGGLEVFVGQSVKEIKNLEITASDDLKAFPSGMADTLKTRETENYAKSESDFPANFRLIISVFYAFFISIGSISWFLILMVIIARYRKVLNVKFISGFVRIMGFVLCLFGIYFGYLGASMIF